MARCGHCGLVEGYFGVRLDSGGLCNYCEHWRSQKPRLTAFEDLGRMLEERIEKLRGRGPYDALVGFSGGKDSTYAIHTLKRRFELKVLAVTFDNGFLSDYARQSIERTIERLEIDHYFHRPNPELHNAYYEAAFKTYGDPCIACAMGIYFHSIKAAYEKGIPMVVHGRSPYQIFRNYYRESPDDFLSLHESNYRPYSPVDLSHIYMALDRSARGWLDRMFPGDEVTKMRVYAEFFLNPASAVVERLPDFVGLFQYLRYDEEAIKAEMEKAIGYRRPPGDELLGHGDCTIHDVSSHLFQRLHGVSATDLEIAAMRRQGALSKEEADALIAQKNAHDSLYPEASVDALCSKLTWTREEFDVQVESLIGRIKGKFPCH